MHLLPRISRDTGCTSLLSRHLIPRQARCITLDRPRTLAHFTSFRSDVSIPRSTASYSLSANKQQRVRRTQDSALAGRTFVLNPPPITPAKKPPSPLNVESAEPVKWRPLKLQLYVWQIPRMLLGWSVMIFVAGLEIWGFVTAKNDLTRAMRRELRCSLGVSWHLWGIIC
jgi:hypothetical protein